MKTVKKIMISLCCILLVAGIVHAQEAVRVYVNGMRINQPNILHDSRTYVPLRAISEALGAEVSWDAESGSAYISFTEDDAIAKVVADVSGSVVTIIGNYDSDSASVQYNNPTVHGSGVIYKSNGHIITNAHVIKNIKNLTVVLNDGAVLPGKVLFSDEKADLAIVKVDKVGLKPIVMASEENIVSGRTAIAIGTPISLSMRNSVTKGIVSGVDVALNDSHYKLIQTDAAINSGNSGGPLLNVKGELIGINSSKYASVGIDNVGFAIPIDTVIYAISQYENNGRIVRPEIDFVIEQSWEAKIGLPTQKGITIKSSSNDKILAGDIITAVNGIAVHSIADWNEAIKDTYNGYSLVIDYVRGGHSNQVEILK